MRSDRRPSTRSWSLISSQQVNFHPGRRSCQANRTRRSKGLSRRRFRASFFSTRSRARGFTKLIMQRRLNVARPDVIPTISCSLAARERHPSPRCYAGTRRLRRTAFEFILICISTNRCVSFCVPIVSITYPARSSTATLGTLLTIPGRILRSFTPSCQVPSRLCRSLAD